VSCAGRSGRPPPAAARRSLRLPPPGRRHRCPQRRRHPPCGSFRRRRRRQAHQPHERRRTRRRTATRPPPSRSVRPDRGPRRRPQKGRSARDSLRSQAYSVRQQVTEPPDGLPTGGSVPAAALLGLPSSAGMRRRPQRSRAVLPLPARQVPLLATGRFGDSESAPIPATIHAARDAVRYVRQQLGRVAPVVHGMPGARRGGPTVATQVDFGAPRQAAWREGSPRVRPPAPMQVGSAARRPGPRSARCGVQRER